MRLEDLTREIVRLTNREKIQNFDLAHCPEDGEKKSFLVIATPYNGLDGRLFGIVESFRDITPRKRAEEALRMVNDELQRIATMDGLTLIANRRRFDECLLTEWSAACIKKPETLLLLAPLTQRNRNTADR